MIEATGQMVCIGGGGVLCSVSASMPIGHQPRQASGPIEPATLPARIIEKENIWPASESGNERVLAGNPLGDKQDCEQVLFGSQAGEGLAWGTSSPVPKLLECPRLRTTQNGFSLGSHTACPPLQPPSGQPQELAAAYRMQSGFLLT